jgi:hypothetical protein
MPRRSAALRLPLTCLALVAVMACNPAPSETILPGPGSDAPGTPTPSAPASTPPATGAVASPAGSPDRTTGWQADIAALVPGMDRLHPDLFHGVSKADLDGAAAALAATVPTATDDELMTGVLRIVAMVGSPATCDGHTGAFIWGSGTYPVESLPLRIWFFDDDAVIVDALPPYQDLVGSTIEAIGDHPMPEVLGALEPLVPRDNLMTIRLVTPRLLLIPEVLRGLGLADAGAIPLSARVGNDLVVTRDVDPIPMAEYNAWAGPYGLHLPANPSAPWLAGIDDALWWDVLDDNRTLFVQYNRVDRLDSGIIGDLRAALRDPAIQRVILDIRHNFGGELSALDPIVSAFDDPAVDQPGKLFVAIGRNTFSAGSILAARLERATAATFVGEPTGGCPTLWGNSEDFLLPYSGIAVSVATERSVGVDANDQRTTIEPDVIAPVTLEEWREGIDPVPGLILPVAP